MKKILFVVLAALFFAAGLTASYAEEQKGAMMHKKDKGSMKHCMMMDKMMPSKMVATTDGGVIVLSGNKLLKYDQNLSLVKEAEIKMDVEAMMKKMKECRDKMKECMDMGNTEGMEAEKVTE